MRRILCKKYPTRSRKYIRSSESYDWKSLIGEDKRDFYDDVFMEAMEKLDYQYDADSDGVFFYDEKDGYETYVYNEPIDDAFEYCFKKCKTKEELIDEFAAAVSDLI